MVTANGVKLQHKSSTAKGVQKMVGAQKKSSRRVGATASGESGGHGTRTRNRFPGTTFPVWPLAIRLPSGRPFRFIVTGRVFSFNCSPANELRRVASFLESSTPSLLVASIRTFSRINCCATRCARHCLDSLGDSRCRLHVNCLVHRLRLRHSRGANRAHREDHAAERDYSGRS